VAGLLESRWIFVWKRGHESHFDAFLDFTIGTLQPPSKRGRITTLTFILSGIMVIQTPDAVQKALSKLDDSDRGASVGLLLLLLLGVRISRSDELY
jgi:hypothetical protein